MREKSYYSMHDKETLMHWRICIQIAITLLHIRRYQDILLSSTCMHDHLSKLFAQAHWKDLLKLRQISHLPFTAWRHDIDNIIPLHH